MTFLHKWFQLSRQRGSRPLPGDLHPVASDSESSTSGWFQSSHDLLRGLDVLEPDTGPQTRPFTYLLEDEEAA